MLRTFLRVYSTIPAANRKMTPKARARNVASTIELHVGKPADWAKAMFDEQFEYFAIPAIAKERTDAAKSMIAWPIVEVLIFLINFFSKANQFPTLNTCEFGVL